jgi:UMF1 family MFS transporter
VLYGAASLVTFRLLRERARPNPQALQEGGFAASLQQLQRTFSQARRYRDFMWLLACAVFYQGGWPSRSRWPPSTPRA